MSNPESPAATAHPGSSESALNRSDTGIISTIASTENGSGNLNTRDFSKTGNMDPVVRLSQLELKETPQVPSPSPAPVPVQKRKSSTGILSKPSGSSASSSLHGAGGVAAIVPDLSSVKMESPMEILPTLPSEMEAMNIPTTPSIVKPRRPSVHFAVDSEPKMKSILPERSKQDGTNRKHRSRKEKLVCRSECPTDMGIDANESRKVSISTPTLTLASTSSCSHLENIPTPSLVPVLHDTSSSEKTIHNPIKMTPISVPPPRATPPVATTTTKMKPRVKRTSTGGAGARVGGSRKNSPNSSFGSANTMREPTVKKKKVIEIVSPRKRKMDHLDVVKTSDPIFIRAANQPFKFKSKSRQNRLKFSKLNFSKSSGQNGSSGHRIRRASSASLQQGSGSLGSASMKQRLIIGSPVKKEIGTEPPCFPPSLISELLWVLKDAEKEFALDRTSKKSEQKGSTASSSSSSHMSFATPADPVAGTSAAAQLAFGRRRVESEPPGAVGGFELAPGSPSGSQSFYHQVRKEVYFSPSPSYVATGPVGRRRYSRRRHARIHPPFDDTNCFFQGHHCPNSKVPGSQYCEKHLDQGPTSGFSYCKYMKDGRQCGNLFSSFEATMTFCEQHANQVAKAEYELRNPKVQPDAAKNILAKINKMFTEGFNKVQVDSLDTSVSNADILQIIDEPEIIQDLPLDNFTGGLIEELDAEGERNVNPDKPDYDALKNAGYYTTEEIIQIHVNKLRKLKALYQREKELEWLTRQHKLKFYKEGLEKLKHYGPKFTTNPYLINKNIDVPKEYIDHQIKQYEAAKAILQTAYKADGEKGLLRLKMLQKAQELARMAKASGQKQHDTVDMCDSDTDADSDGGETRDRRESSRYTGNKSVKCAYNEGYAIQACQNPPVCWSNYCYKHILSDTKQVQWVPCNRRIGQDPQDTCKTPCLKILQKHGCAVHAPLVMSKHKPLRRSEEELNLLVDSDNEEEEISLEAESQVLASLLSDECININHLDETISRLGARGPLEITDTSDSEETDEEMGGGGNVMSQEDEDETPLSSQVAS